MSLRSLLRTLLTLGQGVTVGLPEATADRDPIELFQEWQRSARRSGIMLPEAVTLATCTGDGLPSARMVLLRGSDERGFVFYTNYGSRKARELEDNPRAALVAHWTVLERQVRIEGPVARTTEAESRAYFDSRHRGSRIGAWASRQSETLNERRQLQLREQEFQRKFHGQEVPFPPFWGGYRIAPERIEFWQGRVNRLHDRLLFVRTPDGWNSEWLYP